MSISKSLREPRCACGSNRFRRPLYDARSIFVAYVCDTCERKVRGGYRPEIFTDSNYETCEPIDEE